MSRVIKKYHLSDNPLDIGWRIFAPKLSVAGIQFRRNAARRFISGSQQSLKFQSEPSNKFDSNAIKVIGRSKGWFRYREDFVGYVEADIAAAIADGSLMGRVKPRLEKTYCGKKEYLEIDFQLVGERDFFDTWQEVRPS